MRFHETEKLCKTRDTMNRTKQQPRQRENIFINLTSDTWQIFKIYEELKKFDIKKPNNPIKNRVQI